MGGFDDHVAIIGDWIPPSPSPRTFFSSVISDDVVALSSADSGRKNKSGPLLASHGNVHESDEARASAVSKEASNSNALAETQMTSRGGLMERMAARAGFNAPRLNTNGIRPADLSRSPEIQSPYLTIPPGLSPTTLLDSPVFLSNSLVLPSPTTGKFLFAPTGNNLNSSLMTEDPDKGKENTFEDVNTSSFAFKPVAEEAGSFPCFNIVNKVNPSGVSPLSFANVVVSGHSETPVLCQSVEPAKYPSQDNGALFQQENFCKSHAENNGDSNISSNQTYNSVGVAEHSPPLDEPQEDRDHRSNGDPNVGGGPSEDGYNWRKYGQKQVKGSEYPRSYYKCTHPNCPVKKKVERSEEGHITEIIYKGAHNHTKPPPNRRSILGSSNAPGDMQLDSEQHGIGSNDTFIWTTLQKGMPAGAPDWKQESLEATSSAPLGQDYSIGATALHSQTGQLELADGVDGSSTFSNEEDDDDCATHGSESLVLEGEGDESESKRRRVETYASEISGATRAIREPRVVVQTTSEVDILDDGYRWRKYGQKVVKGNPNPRSYYKCTSPGCNVRKHVERASHDLKSVITTYEGKHNHDVPAARNSSHVNSSSVPTQQAPVSAGSSFTQRPQSSQIQGSSTSHFERPSLASFGRPQLGPGPGFGFGINQPCLASLGMAGLGPNQGRLPGPVFPVNSYLGNQARPLHNNMGFMLPKGEPKMEPVTDSGLNSSNAVSVYQQLMSRMPLGPHM